MGGKWRNVSLVTAEENLDKAVLAIYITAKTYTRSSLVARRSALVLRMSVLYRWRVLR